MALGKADKKYFNLTKGINTEAPLTAWPDGYSIDEQNFDLFPDGSRRRRPVISLERGELALADLAVTDLGEDDACQVEYWNTVNNDSTVNFVVMQVGYTLYFFTRPAAGAPVTDGATSMYIDLRDFRVSIQDPAYSATDTEIREWPVDITFGNGRMFVVGKHTDPFFVTYDATEVSVEATQITVEERDFTGIDDGVRVSQTPVSLTDSHRYNLHNRGWAPANYNAYFTAKGVYPSKSQIMYRGMQRAEVAGINVDDGIKSFSSDKLAGETFQESSAPQGHMRLTTFDIRTGYDPGGLTTMIAVTDADIFSTISTGVYDVTLTTASAHALAVGNEVRLSEVTLFWLNVHAGTTRMYDGVYTVSAVPSATTLRVTLAGPASGAITSVEGGSIVVTSSTTTIIRSTDPAFALQYRFTATAFFAGRVWYGGGIEARLGNRIYFSRITEDPLKSGECYQQADPTSEFISELVATDGGVIVIPELGNVQTMIPFGHSLIVFARNGVWQIGPGELGIFSPTSYSVRKVSDNGCVSRFSALVAEDTPMYWGPDGVYAITQDEGSGYLIAQNATRDVINSLYMNIPNEQRQKARAVYDFYRKRVLWFYTPGHALQTATPPAAGDDMPAITPITPVVDPDGAGAEAGIGYTHALILDLRLGAWYKWAFDNGSTLYSVKEAFSLENDYTVNNETRVKLLVRTAATSKVTIREFRSDVTGFADFDVVGQEPDAFLATGPDSLGEPAKYRYAPIVTVFFKRISGAACYMQARWDWARGTDSGKIGTFYQVYRETRPNPNALAMTVTKNKVAGRGRNLFLFFKVTGTDDAWLDGYTVNYDVQMKE